MAIQKRSLLMSHFFVVVFNQIFLPLYLVTISLLSVFSAPWFKVTTIDSLDSEAITITGGWDGGSRIKQIKSLDTKTFESYFYLSLW